MVVSSVMAQTAGGRALRSECWIFVVVAVPFWQTLKNACLADLTFALTATIVKAPYQKCCISHPDSAGRFQTLAFM